MLGRAVHISAQIEHGGSAALEVGHLARNGRTVNPVHGLEYITGNGHQGTRVARRDSGGGLAIAHLLNGHTHGGIFFLTQSHFERVVRLHHFGGYHHLGSGIGKISEFLCSTHQQEARIRVRRQKTSAGRQRNEGAVVAAHTIDSQSDRGGRGHGILGLKTGQYKSKATKTKARGYSKKVAPGLLRLEG